MAGQVPIGRLGRTRIGPHFGAFGRRARAGRLFCRRPDISNLWRVTLLATTALIVNSPAIHAGEQILIAKEITVNAPLEDVWRSWTTAEGLSFISAASNVELRIGGPYEWFLDGPADEQGKRGSQGSRVLAFLPGRMLAFAWTFPPEIPSLRYVGETSQVVILIEEEADSIVRVKLAAHGFRNGEDWQRGREYFDCAWGLVLDRLKAHLEQ